MTAGHGTDELAKRFEAEHDEYNAIMTKAWPTAWPKPSPSACTPGRGASGATAGTSA